MDKLEVRNRHHVKNAEKGLFAVKIWPQSAKPIRQVAHNIVAKKKKEEELCNLINMFDTARYKFKVIS